MLPTFDPATLGRDSLAFLPELLLCGGIVVLLLLRLVPLLDRVHLGWAALLLAGTALGCRFCQWHGLLTRTRSAAPGGRAGDDEDLRRLAPVRPVDRVPAPVPDRLRHPDRRSVAADGHPRPRGLGPTSTCCSSGDAGDVPDGVGGPLADGLPGGRDGQPAQLRAGGVPQGAAAEQRGGAEVRRLRQRSVRRDALRHQPAGGHLRDGLSPRCGYGPGSGDGDGSAAGDPARRTVSVHRLRLQAMAAAVPFPTSGAPTSSRAPPPRWPAFCPWPRREQR